MRTKKILNKRVLGLLFIICISLLSHSFHAQTTSIPDTNFEQELIDLGIDSDGIVNGQVLTSDIDTVITLNLFNIFIQDLTGIEGFTALEYLDVSGSSLSVLDVSYNIQLKELYCSSSIANPSMFFTTLDVSNNVNLEVLYGETLVELENLNVKNGNNSILTVTLPCEFEGEPCELTKLNCVTVDDEAAATNNDLPYFNWYIQAEFVYSEDCSLGIDEVLKTQISIYPNPAKDVLYLYSESASVVTTVKVYDSLGKLVLEQNNPSTQIDISNLSTGLLFVHIETDNGSIVKKVIKE
ncbi:MAG: hypothetical protein CMC65_09775 [Flavobacteriaceae bacterium]|nr:hypothetical protein [Flavobacteriaceae bacterium]|tara:strand:- start:195 stop:1082 length:888 start_codon:yes stop_codon:yes gene_type:complete